ncbi:MAG: hypothetical protein KatS3mg023_1744 [Armatimonadota bacterium]|nr:MAG: hypothetical protein KatS3mg023_1744 [Armatimonadota bacterium]
MSGWKWKLRRLMAMSPGEIAVRVWRTARDRAISAGVWHPYPDDPVECFQYAWREDAHTVYERFLQRFPCSRHPHDTWREYLYREHPEQAASILAEAEAILQGRMRLLGFEVQTDVPPRWFRNYVQGGEWQALRAERIDYRRGDIAGGVRYCWELNRHGYFLKLAQAWLLTRDRRFAERLRTDWLDWIAHNPPRFGVNWTSMLECALRIHTWCWSLWLVAGCDLWDEQSLQRILGSLWQQVAEISMNLSLGSSANNHLIGEAAGMWTFACLFPTARRARGWMHTAYRILSREIPRQITPDGVTVEQAVHYQVFVMEMALHAESIARQVGVAFPEEYTQRMLASAEFLQAITDCAGHVPHIGDSDDAEVLPFGLQETSMEAAIVNTARTLFEGTLPVNLKAAFLSAQPIRGLQGEKPAVSSRLFAEGGYAVLRDEEGKRVAVIDCGQLGWGSIAAHAHADALSLTLSVDGQPMLVDAGTYCYHDEPVWRNAFRSTRYHNTVCVDSKDQSEMLGAFLWGARAKVKRHRWHTSSLADMLCASHDGYRRIGCGEHIRWFYWLRPDIWVAVDEVEQSEGRCIEQCWLFSQACALQAEGDRMQIYCADVLLWLQPVSPMQFRQVCGAEAGEGGWVSSAFGKREPAPHLFLRRESPGGRLATILHRGKSPIQVHLWRDEIDEWELQIEHLGQVWLVGFARIPRSWQLPGTTVRAQYIAATWTSGHPLARYEVMD